MRSLLWYMGLLVVVALVPVVLPTTRVRAAEAPPFPGWPALDAAGVVELPLSGSERGFAQGFPGKIAKFGDGRRQYVVRWITTATRRVHPAEDCFRASGFAVHHEPRCPAESYGDAGCFTAERDGAAFTVQERITDSEGRSYSDVSAWYWAATRGSSKGPWWSVTRVTPSATR